MADTVKRDLADNYYFVFYSMFLYPASALYATHTGPFPYSPGKDHDVLHKKYTVHQ